MRRKPIALALAATAWVPCGGQSPDAQPLQKPIVFLEKAYFSFKTPTGKDLLFEGQPTVHYFFYNGLSSEQWQADGGWKWAVPVSSVFQVRMSNDDVRLQNGELSVSEPVLTPGYHIGVRGQAFHLRKSGARTRLFGFTFGLTHYSNGQHGCTYRGFTRDLNGKCNPTDPALAGQSIANVVDGDFSTTYFSEAFDVRFTQQTDAAGKPDPFGTMKRSLSLGLEFHQDPLHFRPGGTNREQSEQYGERGLLGRIAGEWRRFGFAGGVTRLAYDYHRRHGGQLDTAFASHQVELSYMFDNANYFGVFARQHWGFDYYNIHFQERKAFLSLGILWDPGRLDHLNAKNPH